MKERMTVEERLRQSGVEVRGTFNPQKFYDALAMILSHKENMDIKIRVIPEEETPSESAEERETADTLR